MLPSVHEIVIFVAFVVKVWVLCCVAAVCDIGRAVHRWDLSLPAGTANAAVRSTAQGASDVWQWSAATDLERV